MTQPLVSVLLPVRNGGPTVALAVRSMQEQTLQALEIVAVNDGSTDDTASVLDHLARGDPRLRHIRISASGLVPALNLGLSVSRAPFVARMDADDESHPERLALSLRALLANPALAAVGTQVEIFSEGQPVSPNMQAYGRWLNSLTCPQALYRDRFVESPLCHPSVTFRKEALVAVGGWEEGDFPEDYQLWLKLLSAGHQLAAIGPELHRWRDSAERLTRTEGRYRPEAFIDLKARFLCELLGRRPATLWGAGRYALKLSRCLQRRGARIRAFVEVDPRKIGQRIDGIAVLGPSDVGPPDGSHLISAVGAKGARAEIRAFLAERGWVEGPDFTCAS